MSALVRFFKKKYVLWPAAVACLLGAWLFGYYVRGLGQKGGGAAPAAETKEKIQHWTCSMHPSVIRKKPGLCPICSMKLVPVYEEGEGGEEKLPPRVIKLTPRAAALAEIETAPVERRFVQKEVRMVGKVAYDETRLAYVTAWVGGRIDRLYVDYTGTAVRKGDHMVYLYSPDLYQAQEELLEAVRAVKTLRKSEWNEAVERAKRTLQAAEEKLRLWGVTDEQIEEIKKQGVPSDHMTIDAPVGGIVIHRNGTEGMYVKTGTRIYTVADLSQVWVMLEAYESDLVWLRYGQKVQFTTESYPGDVFEGRIAFIEPFLNEERRTCGVRVNVPNSDGRLKPGMFVRAAVRTTVARGGRVAEPELAGKWMCPMHPEVVAERKGSCTVCGMPLETVESLGFVAAEPAEAPLVIPALAPLITGKRAVVYVRLAGEKPLFEGREIVLGPRAGEWYLVRAGLAEGERVVTKGNFKLDSELQIRAKPSMMQPKGGKAAMGHHHGGMAKAKESTKKAASKPMEIPTPFKESLHLTLVASQAVELATHRGDLPAVREAYGLLERALQLAEEDLLSDHPRRMWHQLKQKLTLDAVEGRSVATRKEARRLLARFEKDRTALIQAFGPFGEVSQPRGFTQVKEPASKALPEDFLSSFGAAFSAYCALSDRLASDDLKGAKEASEKLAKTLSSLKQGEKVPGWKELKGELTQAVAALKGEAIESYRKGFYAVSKAFLKVFERLGSPQGEALSVFFCPMAFGGRGAVWLGRGTQIRNPYFGSTMLQCGEVKRKVRGLAAAQKRGASTSEGHHE